MRFSADQMHYAYCARRPQAYTELIGCMRKGLPFAGEIIGAARHEEPKPTATAITPPPSKRFKLSLPVDQRKRPFPYPSFSLRGSMTALVRQICGQQWAARVTTPYRGLITTLRWISALHDEVWKITPLRLIALRVRKQYVSSACTLLRMQIARYTRVSSSLTASS